MPRKKNNSGPQTKRARQTITLELKHEILKHYISGMKVHQLAKKFQFANSTVSTIVQLKDKYMSEIRNACPMHTTLIRTERKGFVPEMEKLLIPWLNRATQRRSNLVDRKAVSEKALEMFKKLKKSRGVEAKNEVFCASKKWFDRFKLRAGLHNIRTQKITAKNRKSNTNFMENLAEVIKNGGYTNQQVFCVAQTGLYWKQLPASSLQFIPKLKRNTLQKKGSNERMSLLLGCNAAGDCKLKPLLVYPSKHPLILRSVHPSTLPVIWKYHPNSWMTTDHLKDWFQSHFLPEIINYCDLHSLEGILLILSSSMYGLQSMNHLCPKVKMVCLPPFTDVLLHPMEHGIVKEFNDNYKRTVLLGVFPPGEIDPPKWEESWHSFSIRDALGFLEDSWREISRIKLNAAWKVLCPQFVRDDDFISDGESDAPENEINPPIALLTPKVVVKSEEVHVKLEPN